VNLRARWDYATRHPTWSALIAGLLLSAIVYTIGAVAGYFKSLPELTADSAQWLTAPLRIERWAYLALYGAVIGVTLWALATRRHTARLAAQLDEAKQKPKLSPLLSYREDTFEGIRWRWRYAYDRVDTPDDLKAYCPDCDLELAPHFLGRFATGFVCRDCEKEMAVIHHPDDPTLYDRIKNLITRELRRKAAQA